MPKVDRPLFDLDPYRLLTRLEPAKAFEDVAENWEWLVEQGSEPKEMMEFYLRNFENLADANLKALEAFEVVAKLQTDFLQQAEDDFLKAMQVIT